MGTVGMPALRKKLAQKRIRVLIRYDFYDMKNHVDDFRISTPPSLTYFQPVLGWCAKAVDGLADRLVFSKFKGDILDMQSIYDMNNPDILFDAADLSALISSCSFIYIAVGKDSTPRMQVIDGANATGVIDPATWLLTEGYAVLERDEKGEATVEAYFLPGRTEIYRKGQRQAQVVKHSAQYPLLVPIIHRPDATRPFGRARISRACMSLVSSAVRTLKRSEISAEFYSFPQKYAIGISDDVEIEKWSAAMSAMFTVTGDTELGNPTVGQFQQQSMTPHIEQLRAFASAFAGETGLTLDDLGYPSDNPASSEAIKASHETLRLAARKAQRTFGSGFVNAGYLAACVRDKYAYDRAMLHETSCVWAPTFTPDASALSGIGDGIGKINQAIPGFFGSENLSELTGIQAAD